ncbi:MAG: response regulator transcription factor [Mariprofundaceae bacterium]
MYVDSQVVQHLAVMNNVNGESPFDALSRREFEVFLLLAEGKTRQEIAEQLHLSPKTISNYHAHIMKKLDVKAQTELARLAIRHGIVSA